jgi:hypothetical protein
LITKENSNYRKLNEARQCLKWAAMGQLNLSVRTIANLAGCEETQSVHLAEALQYGPFKLVGAIQVLKHNKYFIEILLSNSLRKINDD